MDAECVTRNRMKMENQDLLLRSNPLPLRVGCRKDRLEQKKASCVHAYVNFRKAERSNLDRTLQVFALSRFRG